MLVLSRKEGEKVFIGENIVVEVLKVKGNRITLGFVAPQEVQIMRSELSKPTAAKPMQVELVVEDGMLVAG